MLCLNRKRGESIVIGTGDDRVVVTILRVNGKVSLGIEAPRSIVVHRSETEADIARNGARKERFKTL